MIQVARHLTDVGDGFLKGVEHLIVDRDPLYTATLRRLLREGRVDTRDHSGEESEFEHVRGTLC